jgi:hypothetical protein
VGKEEEEEAEEVVRMMMMTTKMPAGKRSRDSQEIEEEKE